MVATSRFIVCHVTALPLYNKIEKIASSILQKNVIFLNFVGLHNLEYMFLYIFYNVSFEFATFAEDFRE